MNSHICLQLSFVPCRPQKNIFAKVILSRMLIANLSTVICRSLCRCIVCNSKAQSLSRSDTSPGKDRVRMPSNTTSNPRITPWSCFIAVEVHGLGAGIVQPVRLQDSQVVLPHLRHRREFAIFVAVVDDDFDDATFGWPPSLGRRAIR